MAKLAAVLAALLCAAIWAVHSETNYAGACSGPPGYETLAVADVVFEGWVTSLEPSGQTDGLFTPYQITFEVTRGFRATEAGQTIVGTVMVPDQGIPVMCPQFRTDLLGKFVLLGAFEGDDGQLSPNAWSMIYQSESAPAADDLAYSEVVRLTELATDSSDTAPLLTVTPATPTCGETVTYSGARFEAGEYLIGFSWGQRVIDVVTVGSEGTFETNVTMIYPGCRASTAEPREIIIDVRPAAESDLWQPVSELAAILLQVPGGGDDSYPQLIVPDSARCGAEFTVTGTWFEPNEQVTLMVSASETTYPASANANGTFNARIPMPDGLCGLALGEVRAFQPGFEAYGRSIAGTYFTPLDAPGPPNLGNTTTSGSTPLPWLHLAGLTALILGAGLLIARR